MWIEIVEYALLWNPKSGMARISLKLRNGNVARFSVPNAESLASLGDILRNENPVYFNTDTSDISTGREPTGEGEA